MKPILALFLLASPVWGQQAKPTPKPATTDWPTVSGDAYTAKACDREGDKGCVEVLSVTKDAHGCNSWGGYLWDEKSKTCQIDGSLPITSGELLECHATPQDADGKQRVICSYKPAPRLGER